MKKVLALVLAFALVFGTLGTAFAADTLSADVNAVVGLGMLKGPNGTVDTVYAASSVSKIQAAIMVLRLKGKEAEALAFTGTDNFVDANGHWAAKVMAYLKAHPEFGFAGDGKNFTPDAKITAQMYYKVMLESLGYKQNTADVIGDFTWAGVMDFAKAKGLVKVANVTNLTISDLATATVEALKAPVKGATTTLAETIVAADATKADAAKKSGLVLPVVTKVEGIDTMTTATVALGDTTDKAAVITKKWPAGTIKVTLDNGEVKNPVINWDFTKKVSVTKGTHVPEDGYEGTLAPAAGDNYKVPAATAKASIIYIEKAPAVKGLVAPVAKSVDNGTAATALALPATVEVNTLAFGAEDVAANYIKKTATVTWDTTKYVATTAGDQTITGTLTPANAADFSSSAAHPVTVDAKVTVGAPTLGVDTVTALNQLQLNVKFNKAVDSTTAQTAANYILSSSTVAAFSPASATLQADGVTVLLELAAANAVTNQASLDVKVKNVKDAAKANTIATVTKTVVFTDLTIPSVSKVTVLGPSLYKLWFSEPVKSATPADFLLDGGTFSVTVGTYDNVENSLTFTTGTALAAGAHTLVVNTTSGGNVPAIVDYASFRVPTTTLDFSVVADTTAPTASAITSATQTIVNVKFSKPVLVSRVTTANFYHTYSGYVPDAVAQVNTGTYDDTFKLTFTTYPLPAAAINLYIKRGATGSEIKDAWGNILAASLESLSATVTADVTKPTVTSLTVTDDKTIVAAFSESINVATAQNAMNYIFQDAAGAVSTAAGLDANGHPDGTTSIVYDSTNKKVTFTFAASLTGGSYKLVVSGIKDNALVANTIETATLPFTLADTTAPTIPAATAGVQISSGKITVAFSESMATSGAGSITNPDNYLLNNAALPTGTTLVLGSASKSVVITVPSTTTLALTDTLSVGNVADLAGNKLAGFGKTLTMATAVAPAAIVRPTPRVKLIGRKTLTFEVDQPLSSITVTGFAVTGNTVVGASFVNQMVDTNADVSGALVTLTLGSDAAADATATTLTITNATGTKNAMGTKVADSGALTIADKVAPIVDTTLANGGFTYVNSTTITLTMTENLKAATFAGAGKNGFAVTGGTLSGAALTVPGTDGNVVVLTGTNFTSSTTVSYSGTNIKDVAGNLLATFSATALTDVTAPAAPAVGNYYFNNSTGKVLAIADVTYAEPVMFQLYFGASTTATTAAAYSTSVYLTDVVVTTNNTILSNIPAKTAGTKVWYRTVDMAGNASAWTQDGVVAALDTADVTITDVAGATNDTIVFASTTNTKALVAGDQIVVVCGAETLTYTVQAADVVAWAVPGTVTLTVGGANQVFTGTAATAAGFDTALAAAGTATVKFNTVDGNLVTLSETIN